MDLKVIPKEVDGVRLVNGIEANIFDEHGSIDVEELRSSKDGLHHCKSSYAVYRKSWDREEYGGVVALPRIRM